MSDDLGLPIVMKPEQWLDALAHAWDKGYEDGRDEESFYSRGLSTDSDADTFPRTNPYRRG